MRHTVRVFVWGVVAGLVLAAASGPTWAKNYDQVKPVVTIPTDQPVPLIKDNGATPGTVQLLYTVTAATFPVGPFAQFTLDLSILEGTPGDTKYDPPSTLTLPQTGSQNLVLTPAQPEFTVTGATWTGTTLVTVAIPAEVAADPTLNEDGADLVGNLQLAATPANNQLKTPSTVQVHIRLVHPTACLKVYNFLTAQDDSEPLTSAGLNVKNGLVKATNPGQFSDNVLVVNICTAPLSFDLKVSLDAAFQTNPANNPGNAVFTYVTAGEVDPSTFNLESFGTGTPQGQQLCLGHVTVQPGETFLTTAHSAIQKGIVAPTSASFSATLYGAGSTCTGALDPMADPNPAGTTLSFTSN